MMHTGRTLFHIQGRGEEIPLDHATVGETLRAAGYATHGVGKWHNGTESFNRSFSSGSEILFDGMADHWNVPLFHYDPSGRYDHVLPFIADPFTTNKTVDRLGDHMYAGRHSSEIIGDAGVRFLQEHPKETPYMLYMAFLAPHDPRTMPKKYLDMYDPSEIELPPNFLGGHPFENGDLNGRDEMLARLPRRPDEIRRHIAEYYAMITHVDAQFGRVIEAVRARGDLDNTIFVHCADHGLAVGQHGLLGKQNIYEHSTRVPMIIAGPGLPSDARTDSMVYNCDMFPTLCELTQTPIPHSVQGRSMVPALHGAKTREKLFLAYLDLQRGVRTEKWKLIEYFIDRRHSTTQLFDIANDPWETQNLAADPACAKTLQSLQADLVTLGKEWDDPLLETYNVPSTK
jgi:arylsulfatase A-like enzyme